MESCGYSLSPAYPQLVVGYGAYMEPSYAYGDYISCDDKMKPSCSKNAFQHIEKRIEPRPRWNSAKSSLPCQTSSSNSAASTFSSRKTQTRSRTSASSRCISQTVSHDHNLKRKTRKTSFLDAFRGVLHTNAPKTKRKSPKELEQEERVKEFLKNDQLGSKKWLFYPRNLSNPGPLKIIDSDDELTKRTDRRIKVDEDLFKKTKRKKFYNKSPFTKLKSWELSLYRKLGFVHAV